MKTIALLPLLLLVNIPFTQGQICYEISGSDQSLTISIISSANYTAPSNTFTTGLFTLAWDESLGSDVIQGISSSSNLPFTYDPVGSPRPQLSGGRYYQKFGFTTPSIQNLLDGQSLTVLEINVSHPSISTGSFSIVSTPSITGGKSSLINFFAEQFAEGSCSKNASNVVLPVELLDFQVEKKSEKEVMLEWIVGEEVNVDQYQIERSSDEFNFRPIGHVTAKNAAGSSYLFIDVDDFLPGNYYYRLKMIDLDGSFTYSWVDVVNFTVGSISKVSISPNPTRNQLQIKFPNQEKGLFIEIFNAHGARVHAVSPDPVDLYTINTQDWPGGVYFLKISPHNGQSKTYQFIVSR